jgi:hypothetical protein
VETDLLFQVRGDPSAISFDVLESIVSIDMRLPLPEQVQVEAVEDVDRAYAMFLVVWRRFIETSPAP